MRKIILISVSIIVIIIGVFAFIPKNSFVMPNIQKTEDNILNIIDIENYITQTNAEEILYSRNWQVDGKELGNIVIEYMEKNNLSELGIRTNMTKNSVEFICFEENINNQKFYYSENGDLIAYISASNKNDGKVAYYFLDNKQISINNKYENKDEYVQESETDILQRASIIYNEYIVEKECKVDRQDLSETVVNNDGILIGNVNIKYIVLSRNENGSAINKINKKIKSDAENRYNENLRMLKNIGKNIKLPENIGEEMPTYNYYVKESYEQKYLDYKTISYIINGEKYFGEEIEQYMVVKNYDLLTGKELELTDIYTKDKKELNTKLINKFQIKYDKYLFNDNVLNNNINKVKFYLTNDNIVFYFDKGVVSNNIPEIQLKYIELK